MNLLEELLESAVFQQISKKLKTPESFGIQGFQWSCWADSNRRPHPYQQLWKLQSVALQGFLALFALRGMRSQPVYSIVSIRLFPRVGQRVGQSAYEGNEALFHTDLHGSSGAKFAPV